jgi:hypothetical protein
MIKRISTFKSNASSAINAGENDTMITRETKDSNKHLHLVISRQSTKGSYDNCTKIKLQPLLLKDNSEAIAYTLNHQISDSDVVYIKSIDKKTKKRSGSNSSREKISSNRKGSQSSQNIFKKSRFLEENVRIKPILRTRNKHTPVIPQSSSSSMHKRVIKFADECLNTPIQKNMETDNKAKEVNSNNMKPLAQIIKVPSYRKFNIYGSEVCLYNEEEEEEEAKVKCKCACLVF